MELQDCTYEDIGPATSVAGTVQPTHTPIVRVVIGHGLPALLRGLEALVETLGGMRVAAAECDFDAFVRRCSEVGRGVALADATLCPDGTRALVDRMRQAAAQMRLLLIGEPQAHHQVRAALHAGACGFVAKTDEADRIRSAIEAVAAGRRFLSPVMAQCLADSMGLAELTGREMDVLRLLARGCCNKTIARELSIGIGTVKTHMHAVMSKLSAQSRMQAVLRAGQLGIISI